MADLWGHEFLSESVTESRKCKVSEVRLAEVKEVREPTRSDLDGRGHWKRSSDDEIGQSGERVDSAHAWSFWT